MSLWALTLAFSSSANVVASGVVVGGVVGGDQGWQDGPSPLFYEPGGLAAAGDTLYVADTNNHVIRRIDLTEGTATTLVLSGLDAMKTTNAVDPGNRYIGWLLSALHAAMANPDVRIAVINQHACLVNHAQKQAAQNPRSPMYDRNAPA